MLHLIHSTSIIRRVPRVRPAISLGGQTTRRCLKPGLPGKWRPIMRRRGGQKLISGGKTSMPKFSDDRVLQQSIEPAALDRESYADAVKGSPEEQDALAMAERTRTLRGKKLAKLAGDDLETARLTLLFAEQYETGFADSNPGEPHKTKALQAAKRIREVRIRLFGRTAFEVMVSRCVSVPVQDILNTARRGRKTPE